MSAFYDIWIGNIPAKPLQNRQGNNNWQQCTRSSFSVWESLPSVNKAIQYRYETETHQLIVVGQFYEEVDLKTLLCDCLQYVDKRQASFSEPAGSYILFIINTDSCHVFTDRFGTYHAYWLAEGNNNIICTYYWDVVKQMRNKQLDWQAIGGFLSMGFFPLDKTYFDSIKVFMPASCYSFDSSLNLQSSGRYWDWQYKSILCGDNDYLPVIHETLQSSLRYSTADKTIALPLSGGLDSRTIAGVMSNVPGSHWAYSYGFAENSSEVTIGNEVADAAGMSFDGVVVPPYLFAKTGIITDSTELFQYIDGTRQMCMFDRLSSKADAVVCGHWGDVWFDSMNINAIENQEIALKEAFQKKILKKGRQQLLALFSDYIKDAPEHIDSYFTSYMQRYSHVDDADLRFKIFKTDQWSFRWTVPSLRTFRAATMPVLPFYDKRLADILMQVPPTLLKGRALQIEYLKRYFPALAKIKWQEYDSNLYRYKWLNNRNIVYRVADKVKRELSREQRITRNADLFYLNPEGERQLRAVLNENLSGDIIPEPVLNNFLDSYYKKPDAGNTYAVSMLHTFAQFINKIS